MNDQERLEDIIRRVNVQTELLMAVFTQISTVMIRTDAAVELLKQVLLKSSDDPAKVEEMFQQIMVKSAIDAQFQSERALKPRPSSAQSQSESSGPGSDLN